MTSIDPASLAAVAALLHQVDAAQHAWLDANTALEAVANAGEPEWLVYFEALCRAGDDCDSAEMELAEAMREALDGPAAEGGED